MAIIKCPECGHQVSDKAPVCPSCGVEIAGKIPAVPATPPAEQQPDKKKGRTTLIVSFLIALLVCAVMFYFYTDAKSNKEAEAYEYAMQSSDPAVLQSYLDNYRDASEAHRDSITAHLTRLQQVDNDWTNALVSNSKTALQDYLANHPDSPHKQEVLQKIDSIDWEAVASSNTIDSYTSYLEDHPNGDHVDEAKDGIKALNAKIIHPEEEDMINGVFQNFFQAINARDESRLTNTLNSILTTFLGKRDATKSDVITFLHKIYKDDILNMNWKLNNDYKITKKEVGENEYEYSVQFSVVQSAEYQDASKNGSFRYKISAKIGPDDTITEMNMTRIIE